MSASPYYRVARRATLVRSQRWGWTLYAGNGKKIATSGEGYTSKAHAEQMVASILNGGYRHAQVRP